MKKQPYFLISGLVIIISIILICGYSFKTEDKGKVLIENDTLVFRMAVNGHEEHPSTQGAEVFVDLVEKRTNGEVKILLYDENDIGSENNITEQIEFGGIDFAIVSALYLIDYVDRMKDLLSPEVFKDTEDMMNALNNDIIGGELKESFKNEKINILGWYQGSSCGISHEVPSIDELVGKKVRVPERQLMINEISSIRFFPVPAKVEEINNYLKSDYIEAAEEELLEYYYHSTDKIVKYFTFTSWIMLPEAIIASNTAMKQLTVEQQMIIAEAAKESSEFERLQIQATEEKVMKELKEKGVIFHEADPACLEIESYFY